MDSKLIEILQQELQDIRSEGLYKEERLIGCPQDAVIKVSDKEVINFCANNYLGLSSHPDIIKAAHQGLDDRGFGMSSVRFICGTQDIHKQLEDKVSRFLEKEDTILYSSCFDANGGLFETLLSKDDAIISDALNHASIIDGVRLCKAQRRRFKHADMFDLEQRLKESAHCRLKMIATDGVFSMDGDYAPLQDICDLAEKYQAIVMVDDSHSTGFVGKNGRGTPEYFGVMDRIDIITSTFGKALGGASGGFTAARKEIIDFLRQRSRPYLFSNALAPAIVYASIKGLELIEKGAELRKTLAENTRYFRTEIKSRGFTIIDSDHPIIPVMLGKAQLAQDMAKDLLVEGIYVIGFSYPVVPKEQARIRLQMSAAHSPEMLQKAIEAFDRVGKKYGIIS